MTIELSEAEMREALFGPTTKRADQPIAEMPAPAKAVASKTPLKKRTSAKPLSPKLRVTLHVSKEFEGDVEVFVYDADTLSTLLAEQDAKRDAKKKNYKYCELISVRPI